MEITVYAHFNNQSIPLTSPQGFTLMQSLKTPENHGKIIKFTQNILASCGGNMSCSSCIVKIDDQWIHQLEPMEPQEYMLIDIFLDQYGLDFIEGQYRLSCQIILTQETQGLQFHLVNN